MFASLLKCRFKIISNLPTDGEASGWRQAKAHADTLLPEGECQYDQKLLAVDRNDPDQIPTHSWSIKPDGLPELTDTESETESESEIDLLRTRQAVPVPVKSYTPECCDHCPKHAR